MRTFAYCARSWRKATRRAAGVQPLTCPPVTADCLDPSRLEDHDFLYFDFHGLPGKDYWFALEPDEMGMPIKYIALRADQIRVADLDGSVIFAPACHLGDDDSPIRRAFLDAGAGWIVGGEGQNYAGGRRPIGAALLGLWFRRMLKLFGPEQALQLAKARLKLTLVKDKLLGQARDEEDALAFRSWRGTT